MTWINIDESAFYAAVWLIGFASAAFSLLGDQSSQSRAKCVYLGGVAGFLAFSTVALFVGRINGPIIGHWYYLGMASLIGLSAKQMEALRSKLFGAIIRFGNGLENGQTPNKDD